MAERRIIWSHRAKINLHQILEYYDQRNQDRAYSKKIYRSIRDQVKLLIRYPRLGVKTDVENVRGLILDEFIVFYEFDEEKIIVHTIWDTRRDPDELIPK